MIHENQSHHQARDMLVSGPTPATPDALPIKGLGFRGTPIYGQAPKRATRVSMYIETPQRQVLFVAPKGATWERLCSRLKDFPSGVAVWEENGQVVKTTYSEKKRCDSHTSKKKKKSTKIRWP